MISYFLLQFLFNFLFTIYFSYNIKEFATYGCRHPCFGYIYLYGETSRLDLMLQWHNISLVQTVYNGKFGQPLIFFNLAPCHLVYYLPVKPVSLSFSGRKDWGNIIKFVLNAIFLPQEKKKGSANRWKTTGKFPNRDLANGEKNSSRPDSLN